MSLLAMSSSDPSSSLPHFQSIAFDSNILIYFFEETNFLSAEEIELWLRWTTQQQAKIILSPLVITEVLSYPFQHDLENLIETYTRLDVILPNISYIPFTPSIATLAANLKARYNFRTPDSIHLATAIESNADFFLTADKKLQRCTDIQVKVI